MDDDSCHTYWSKCLYARVWKIWTFIATHTDELLTLIEAAAAEAAEAAEAAAVAAKARRR